MKPDRAQTLRRHAAIAVVVLLLGQIGRPVAAQDIANPKLYEKSLQAASQAYAYYGAYDDPTKRRRVNDIGYRLAVVSDFREFPLSFYVVDMAVPNAFALPGGHIFVTRGMLDLGLTDDMLANLLGHELAHVIYEHGVKMKRRATVLNMLSMAALLGVMVGASDEPENPYDPYGRSGSRKGSLVEGTAAAGMALSELLLRDYSRDFENEADVEGQRLAAAAGYDPNGAHELWKLMNARIPEKQVYGYWRTHPFSEQRMRAAEVRAVQLKILEGEPTLVYRNKTQRVLLDFLDRQTDAKAFEAPPPPAPEKPPGTPPRTDTEKPPRPGEDLRAFLELSALHAWPEGERAEAIRLKRLHAVRSRELDQLEMARDYGELLETYREELEEVRTLTPKSPFLKTLGDEIDALEASAKKLYPKAREIWTEGIYQTPFLETYLSNYPDSPEAPDVALALGNAYSRLRRETEAVERFLKAAEAGPETEAGKSALLGLRNLAPYLEKLAALQTLADFGDPELAELANKRLDMVDSTYKTLENGGEYLERFPGGTHAPEVRQRLENLASNLYGEVVLYQGVGDHVKALDRIQKILEHAPFTRAAEMLRDQAVFDG